MVNQQLLEYIKQSIQQGVSREQIKSTLMANGWQAQDVEEGWNNVHAPSVPRAHSVAPMSTSSNTRKVIVGIMTGIVVVGGGTYVVSQTIFKSEKMSDVSPVVAQQLPTETPFAIPIPPPPSEPAPTPPQPSEPIPTQVTSQNPEPVFADALRSCTKHRMTFEHPFTGEMLEKEILGFMNETCNYTEQMPNGGKMECQYSESERIAVAQYYRDVAIAESVGTSLRADFGSGEQQTTYTINGKVVDNPLQEAMDSGACVISGYES